MEVEHALSISTHSKADTYLEWLEKYSLSSHAFIFSTVKYSLWIGVLVQIVSRVATFTWNFTDLFLMLLGQALTLRFDQFNTALQQVQVFFSSSLFWLMEFT
jgi:Trehalose receptor